MEFAWWLLTWMSGRCGCESNWSSLYCFLVSQGSFTASMRALVLVASVGNGLVSKVVVAMRRIIVSAIDIWALPRLGYIWRSRWRSEMVWALSRRLMRGLRTACESMNVMAAIVGGSMASASSVAQSSPVLLELSVLPVWHGTI